MTARILIVDDEPSLLRTLQRALTSYKYQVVTVADPNSAYQILGESSFDLVLLDLRLPHMDGATFFLAIIRRWPQMVGRIILMSGDPWSELADAPPELAGCPVLPKPFSLETLLTLIRTVLTAAETQPKLLEGNGNG
ncbi:MAG TPA: response regulator [Gemmatimonadales bacterium]|nr:response regulator [Gemmatimonadales bacterium]